MNLTEDEMRRAMGLVSSTHRTPEKVLRNPVVSSPTIPEIAKEKPNLKEESRVKYQAPYIYLRYSVREKWGGPVFSFEHKAKTIFMTEAKLEAERLIKEKGLVVWALVECEQFS